MGLSSMQEDIAIQNLLTEFQLEISNLARLQVLKQSHLSISIKKLLVLFQSRINYTIYDYRLPLRIKVLNRSDSNHSGNILDIYKNLALKMRNDLYEYFTEMEDEVMDSFKLSVD